MRPRIVLLLLFAALLAAAAYQTAGAPSAQTRELAPGVFLRQAEPDKRIIANAGWVVFRDYVLVIDANYPWGARAILDDIRKTTNKPIRFVFDTHYHGDHAHGNGVFTAAAGATIVCSADCAEESLRKNPAAWQSSAEAYKSEKLEHPQLSFPERMAFDDGTHRVELIKVGPGHTLGDAVAWLPKERILFTGDLCVNWTSGNNVADADADHDNWIRTLDKMAQANPSTVVVGHGDLGGVPELRKQKEYLSDMLRVVREGIRAGKSGEEIANAADLTSHKIGTDPARNKASILAVHRKLTAK